jgi:hypothetical protein
MSRPLRARGNAVDARKLGTPRTGATAQQRGLRKGGRGILKGSKLFHGIGSLEPGTTIEEDWPSRGRKREKGAGLQTAAAGQLEERDEGVMGDGVGSQACLGCCRRAAWAAARHRRRADGEWGREGKRVKGGEQAKLRRLLRRSQEREQAMRVGLGLLVQELWGEECMRGWVQGQLHVAQAVVAVQSRQRSMAEAGLAVCRDDERPKRRREELGWRQMSSVVERGVQTIQGVEAEAGQVEQGTQTAMQPSSAVQSAPPQRSMQSDMPQQGRGGRVSSSRIPGSFAYRTVEEAYANEPMLRATDWLWQVGGKGKGSSRAMGSRGWGGGEVGRGQGQ